MAKMSSKVFIVILLMYACMLMKIVSSSKESEVNEVKTEEEIFSDGAIIINTLNEENIEYDMNQSDDLEAIENFRSNNYANLEESLEAIENFVDQGEIMDATAKKLDEEETAEEKQTIDKYRYKEDNYDKKVEETTFSAEMKGTVTEENKSKRDSNSEVENEEYGNKNLNNTEKEEKNKFLLKSDSNSEVDVEVYESQENWSLKNKRKRKPKIEEKNKSNFLNDAEEVENEFPLKKKLFKNRRSKMIVSDDDEMFEIERIESERYVNRNDNPKAVSHEYLIKWKGYDDTYSLWQPVKDYKNNKLAMEYVQRKSNATMTEILSAKQIYRTNQLRVSVFHVQWEDEDGKTFESFEIYGPYNKTLTANQLIKFKGLKQQYDKSLKNTKVYEAKDYILK